MWLRPGTRIKLKGTRDKGYRKIHSFNGDHVIGFQFYYTGRCRDMACNGCENDNRIVDETTTTSNHITNLRKVLVGNQWKDIRELL